MAERLDGWLSRQGLGTRSEVRERIKAGRVRVGGTVIRDPARKVDGPVEVDGAAIAERPDAATLLIHKPLGVSCSHDPREEPLVFDLVPAPWDHLAVEAAGRLDRDTSGLLVLTTDGQLIHALTSPKRHREKRYRIAYLGALSSHAVERVATGIALDGDDRPTLPARLELEPDGDDGLGRATLWLREGRYHQVRRMIAALGGSVVRLHRDRIGALDLPADLAPGAVREARPDEIAALMSKDA